MPDEIVKQISDIFNAMGYTVFQVVLLYIAAPVIIVAIAGRFLLKIRGKLLSALVLFTLFAGLYFFVTNGLPSMNEIYLSKLNK